MRVAGHRRIIRLLRDAGCAAPGLILVLVDAADDDTDRVAALLEG